MKKKNLKFDSKLIHAGQPDDAYGSATVPIYQTSTFAFRSAEHGAHILSTDAIYGPSRGIIENHFSRFGV